MDVRSFPMEYHLLLPGEAATLLGTSPDAIRSLIAEGKLGAFRDDDEWWIPLQCLSTYTGSELEIDAACALAGLLRKDGPFARTFVEHPEAAAVIERADHAPGSVGACLKQALVMFRRAQAGDVRPQDRH
jgi:hypothetical protein